MLSPDPKIVQKFAKEGNAHQIEGVETHMSERVDITDLNSSSSGSKEILVYEKDFSHKRRLKNVKAIEKRLKRKVGLKWY